jgi:molecular chaperone IbpA
MELGNALTGFPAFFRKTLLNLANLQEDKMANLISFSPLMRSSVGFDRFNDLFESLIEGTEDRFDTYPPYNIEKIGEDDYRIVMAVAGFTENDLNITAEGDTLLVNGRIDDKADEGCTYLHRGIVARAFQRSFRLADHIKITGADMKNGLLTINLVREVPEEKKPRMIQINASGATKAIEGKKKN